MTRPRFRIILALVLAAATSILGATAEATRPAFAQSKELIALDKRVQALRAAGKYAEAIPLAEQVVRRVEAEYGAAHVATGGVLGNLAILYVALNRHSEAEALYKRSLVIWEKALGPAHPDITGSLDTLAGFYRDRGRLAEAEPLFRRSLAIREGTVGSVHPDVERSLLNLAELYRDQRRFAEAEALLLRALAVTEKLHGATHPDVARSLNNLANVYNDHGQFTTAEELYQRSLAIADKALGPAHPDSATTVYNLANLYRAQGRLADAERLYQRSLAIQEKALGTAHPDLANNLSTLASLNADRGRPAEAEAFFRRSLAIREKALGGAHPDVAATLNDLANFYNAQGRYAEAEQFYRRSLAIEEKALGPMHPRVAHGLNNLAGLYQTMGRSADARPLLERSLAIAEKAYGPQHPDMAGALNNLALLDQAQGRFAQAELLHKRSLAIRETLWADHPDVVVSLRNLGSLELDQNHPPKALAYFRRAAAIESGMALRVPSGERAGEGPGQNRFVYFGLTMAAWRTAALAPDQTLELSRETFESAQWVGQEATGAALAQMAARFGAGSGPIAALVRERQDLIRERQSLDKALATAVSASGEQRNEKEIAELRTAIATADPRLAEMATRLEREVPGYAELASPKPLPLIAAQRLLRADEALVVYLVGFNDENFVWALTREGSRWQRIPLGEKALAAKVAALRKGLDADDLKTAAETGALFDLGLAHELHEALLAPVADILKGKSSLIVVPSGPLTSLPFHLLVTDKPAVPKPDGKSLGAYAKATWLIRRHAVTVLPSVSSLRALRVLAKAAPAPKPLIGFGDPVFGQVSSKTTPPVSAIPAAPAQRSASRTRALATYYRGDRADLDALRAGLSPLPETATELRAVARSVNATEADLRLGPAASETAVKSTDLTPYRIVYFATHGLVSGELKGLAEPALALSIPATPTDLDDGLLTASEVAQLKLNADWVVLSACNTAAGDTPGADALSGLARAFFYAGARALLVSHWKVDSDAAVRLTTATFAALQKDPSIGRSEALRRAMLATIDDTKNPWNAYPDLWAPFSVVGEGGR